MNWNDFVNQAGAAATDNLGKAIGAAGDRAAALINPAPAPPAAPLSPTGKAATDAAAGRMAMIKKWAPVAIGAAVVLAVVFFFMKKKR